MEAAGSERIGIYADWMAAPVWQLDDGGHEICNGIHLLRGSPLSERLHGWARRWDENLDVDGQSESVAVENALLDELRELAVEVQHQLGPTYAVELRLGDAYVPSGSQSDPRDKREQREQDEGER